MTDITTTEGQATPSHATDIGGQATADAGTGGAERYGELSAADRTALRQTLAAAHPDAIPELIDGATVGEMVSSLQTAKAAYRRTIERAKATLPISTGATGRPTAVDVSKLSPLAKIAVGLKEQ
jgi:hypothetical protein